MFVLKNVWAQLIRHKWRTLLTTIIALIVACGSLFGLSVGQAHTTATTDDYDALAPAVAFRMNAAQQAKYDGTDPTWTKNYLSIDDYNDYYAVATAASIQLSGMNAAASLPVRQTSDSVQAIAGTDDQDADKTGGEFTLASFTSVSTAHDNELGSYKVVEGKHLSYGGSAPKGALISQALADKNKIKVGDKITVASPTDADTTYTFTVRGIYQYDSDAPAGHGSDAKLAKDNRDNAIYVSYTTLYNSGLSDTEATTGWGRADVSYIFEFSSMSDYTKYKKKVEKKLADNYEVTSPTLTAYERKIAPLTSLNSNTRIATIVLLVAGGLLLLALVILGLVRRSNEIGTALVCGVTHGRLAWQFMLEVLLPTVIGLAIGLLIGGFATKPLGTALANGYSTPVTGAMIWHVTWIGLCTALVLAIIAAVRVVAFGPDALFKARVGAVETATENDATAADAAGVAADSADDTDNTEAKA